MADSKISALPASTTPLAGTEVLPIVQSSTTKQVSVANLTAGRTVSAAAFTGPLDGIVGGTAPAAGTFTTLIYSNTTLANYLWTDWAPSDVTGTTTNAPGTGTTDNSNFVSLSNSSGTLTITFSVAGKYLISIISATQHSQTYTYDNLYLNFGGTATIRQPTGAVPCNSGEAALAQNFAISSCYYVSATAAQTLTILPQYRIVGAGTTANHTAGCGVAIQYCGG